MVSKCSTWLTELLGEMAAATGIEAYQRLSKRPDKFVHGYGIFQYDLQFFKDDPDFFLQQQWQDIDVCVSKMMKELMGALKHLGLSDHETLTDEESCFAAIVYNTGFGNFKRSKGLQQGYFDGKHYYGENIEQYLKIARAIPSSDARPSSSTDVQAPTLLSTNLVQEPKVVAIAKAELARYGGIDEGDEPLRSRIADYYEAGGGSRDLDPTRNENAWSAAFISYCIRGSGATPQQFRFNLSHSFFVKAAIANGDSKTGVFRGHRVGEYAPRPGDIIHHNRDGGTLSFDFAREHTGYPSHSAIVVGFDVQNGVRGVVTIGGNEGIAHGSGTVGNKFFALDANGFLDQSRIKPLLICVIENVLAGGTLAMVPGAYVVRVRTELQLRGGPGSDFPIIRPLLDGTKLNVLDFEDTSSGRWALVDLEGDGIKDGFVFAKFIEPELG